MTMFSRNLFKRLVVLPKIQFRVLITLFYKGNSWNPTYHGFRNNFIIFQFFSEEVFESKHVNHIMLKE